MAVGGQGGGVLTGWIAALGERAGWHVQATSVAGVAQRTGATIYYIEMAPDGPRGRPVFALSPAPGHVDVLIAAEIMEAGRAAQRGFVTPDRTVLVASTHRILAVSEKQVPGDGRGDGAEVLAALRSHAAEIVAFDMEAVAREAGSVISASLFGGLARSGALPFAAAEFEAVIAGSGRGVEASLAAFRGALDWQPPAVAPPASEPGPEMAGPAAMMAEWSALCAELTAFDAEARNVAAAALGACVDYQDLAYGAEWLEHLRPFLGRGVALERAAAKYVARAMCYDDLIRVADLKTRARRAERVRVGQGVDGAAVLRVTEYVHPGAAEVCSALPRGLGAWIEGRAWAFGALDWAVNRGRRVRTDRISGFAMLWLVASLRPARRRLLRHGREVAHLEALVARALAALPGRPELAAEVLACQRLVKGYSDTHARGLSKFDRVMEGAAAVWDRADAADWVRRLRAAALEDEAGQALDGAVATVRSFAGPARDPERGAA